jgi:glycosyltransferase involved in cell wall biosynthesis
MNPFISVIIPAYNAEKYLAEAIKSILAQNYTPLEIIIVDDGSQDNTATVAQSFGALVRYFHQANEGAAAARNFGVQHARADWLAFLDADDLWTENKLATQVTALQADPTLDVIFGHARNFIQPDEPAAPRVIQDILPAFAAGAMLIHKDALMRVGGFSGTLRRGETLDFYIRVREQGLKEHLLHDLLLLRRIHTKNMGVTNQQGDIEYVRILKSALDRKRGRA